MCLYYNRSLKLLGSVFYIFILFIYCCFLFQCESVMMSNLFRTPADYCQSRCAKKLMTKEFFENSRLIYNDKYKFVYCPVPKVGVSNWRRVLLVLSGKLIITNPLEFSLSSVHGTYYSSLSYLAYLNLTEIDYRLKHYYKFVFIRDPFERILSAYMDKFQRKNRFAWAVIGKLLIKNYRNHPDKNALTTGLGVTFDEFVQYILDSSVYSCDEHWRLMATLCLPCSMRYDYVGHLDTIDSDSEKILDKLGVSHLVQYPKRFNDHHYEKTKSLLLRYYRTIPLARLRKLRRIYYLDYLTFNLTFPPILNSLFNK